MADVFLAVCIIFGYENTDWIYCLVDVVEWSDVKYNHQN